MLNLDTHIVVKSLDGSLKPREASLIGANDCGISAIVLWEIQMLSMHGRIGIDLHTPDLLNAISRLVVWPLDTEVCRRMSDLDFESDPADMIIAATSLAHGVPLLTRDKRIASSSVVPLA